MRYYPALTTLSNGRPCCGQMWPQFWPHFASGFDQSVSQRTHRQRLTDSASRRNQVSPSLTWRGSEVQVLYRPPNSKDSQVFLWVFFLGHALLAFLTISKNARGKSIRSLPMATLRSGLISSRCSYLGVPHKLGYCLLIDVCLCQKAPERVPHGVGSQCSDNQQPQ